MNWIDEEVAFYDFIWAYGNKACTDCINADLYEDFKAGGDLFKKMTVKILEKYPTRAMAWKAYRAHVE